MELHIVSPEKTETYPIAWLEAHTPVGSFTILPEHAPTILLLAPGKKLIFCLTNGKQKSVTVPRGILEVTRAKVILLINK